MIMKDFLTLPPRSQKPRECGITHVLDKGLGVRQIEDSTVLSASEYVDFVKLGWGTGYIAQDLRDKINLYQQTGFRCFSAEPCWSCLSCKTASTSIGRWRSPLACPMSNSPRASSS